MNRYAHLMAKTSLLGLALGCSSAALAQDTVETDESNENRTIIVTGVIENPLVEESATGSRLGLTPLETPASVYSIDGDTIRAMGDIDFSDAVSRAPGIAQSQTPGSGTISVTARGFGSSSVLQLYNGVRLFPNNSSLTFPFDTWNIERIEVLTGPASVLYGQGALGGVINVIPKSANFERAAVDAEFRYGSFNTSQAAIGVTAPLTDTVAFRVDGSVRSSDGYVDRGDSKSVALSGALEFRPHENLSLVLRHDFGDQKPMRYWGTPLANGTTLDTSIRERNYNVADAVLHYEDHRTQLSLEWDMVENVRFDATAFHLTSRRHWENLESYFYDPDEGEVLRTDHLGLIHDVEQTGAQANLTVDTPLGDGAENRLVVGIDYNLFKLNYWHNSFPAQPDAVDPRNFNPGLFSDAELAPRYRTRTETWAVYAEDRISIGEQFSIIAGVRYETDKVERYNFVYDAAGENIVGETPGFAGGRLTSRKFDDFTWRVGAVYQPTRTLSLFAQYVTGVDPLGMLTTPSTAPDQIAFTNARGNQIEAGVKSTFLDGAGWATVSVFRIVKNDLAVQRTTGGPIEQIGQQSSQGIEAALSIDLAAGFGIEANAMILDANFDEYPGYADNTPPGVPQKTANLTLRYSPVDRFQVRGSLRYVGSRYSNIANTISIPEYAVVDASATYAVTERVAVDFRVFNLFDKDYVINSYGSQQWILGRPRAFEVGVRTSF